MFLTSPSRSASFSLDNNLREWLAYSAVVYCLSNILLFFPLLTGYFSSRVFLACPESPVCLRLFLITQPFASLAAFPPWLRLYINQGNVVEATAAEKTSHRDRKRASFPFSLAKKKKNNKLIDYLLQFLTVASHSVVTG